MTDTDHFRLQHFKRQAKRKENFRGIEILEW